MRARPRLPPGSRRRRGTALRGRVRLRHHSTGLRRHVRDGEAHVQRRLHGDIHLRRGGDRSGDPRSNATLTSFRGAVADGPQAFSIREALAPPQPPASPAGAAAGAAARREAGRPISDRGLSLWYFPISPILGLPDFAIFALMDSNSSSEAECHSFLTGESTFRTPPAA